MSYWFSLDIDTGGKEPATVWDGLNATSNVSPMWREALGHPMADLDGTNAGDAVAPLAAAIARMEAEPAKYEAMNPTNGWGDSDGALDVLRQLHGACVGHPRAKIAISR